AVGMCRWQVRALAPRQQSSTVVGLFLFVEGSSSGAIRRSCRVEFGGSGSKAILPPRQKSSTVVGLFLFLAGSSRGSIRRSFRDEFGVVGLKQSCHPDKSH